MKLEDVSEEMRKAIAFLQPKLRGLQDLPLISISGGLADAIGVQFANFSRRNSLCVALLNAVENLLGDGYPSLPVSPLSKQLEEELETQIADIKSVGSLFEPEPPAANIVVNLGPAVDKP